MDAGSRESLSRQVGREEVRVPLGLDEDEGAVGADIAQDLRQLVPLPELLDLEELLLHVGAGASNDADGQEEVVVQEF